MEQITISGTVSEWQESIETVFWACVGLGVCVGVVGCLILSTGLALYRDWCYLRDRAEDPAGGES